jgi:hypothetical protein
MGKMSGLFAASKLNTNSLYYKFYQYFLYDGGTYIEEKRPLVCLRLSHLLGVNHRGR